MNDGRGCSGHNKILVANTWLQKMSRKWMWLQKNFTIELLGISWLHELDGKNLLSGKFLHCCVNYPSCWDILVIL